MTTIGNLGQYWSFEVPGGQDALQVTEATVRAIGMLAAWRDRGALVHSYLDDGVAMQASHYGAYVGWAALERYVVEDLCGARLAHSYGGLVDDPWHRAVVHLAVDDVHDRDHLGSMVYGNTVDMRAGDRAHNEEVLRRYLTVDLACQLRRPTGHAVHPVPLTEAERVPTGAENLEVQLLAHALDADVRRSGAVLDWDRAERVAGEVAAYARTFRDAALRLLDDDGVDVARPGGAAAGPAHARHGRAGGAAAPAAAAGRRRARARGRRGTCGPWPRGLDDVLPDLRGTRVVLAVLDVHDVVRDALLRGAPPRRRRGGAAARATRPRRASCTRPWRRTRTSSCSAPTTAPPSPSAASSRAAVDATGYDGPVIIGGKLNQDLGGDSPVEVADDLRALGLLPAATLAEAARLLGAIRRRTFT